MPKELLASLPDSAKSTISLHNHQYQVNTTEQDNAGHIPKSLWEQLPPYSTSAISNAQHHNKQLTNSTTVNSYDHTDHSVADTLPTYASNSVHHMPTETALPCESSTVLNSLLQSSVPLVIPILSMLPVAIESYTPMVVCTLL